MDRGKAAELLRQWNEAFKELVGLRAQYIVVETVQPGEDIESPRPLTPEAFQELDRLQRRVDELWRDYRRESSS